MANSRPWLETFGRAGLCYHSFLTWDLPMCPSPMTSLGWPEIGLTSWTNAAEFCSQDQALLAGLLERLALKNFSAAAPAHVGSHCNPAARIDQQRLGRLIQMLPQDEALGNSRVVDAPVPSSSASSCPKPSAAPDRFLRRISKTL